MIIDEDKIKGENQLQRTSILNFFAAVCKGFASPLAFRLDVDGSASEGIMGSSCPPRSCVVVCVLPFM